MEGAAEGGSNKDYSQDSRKVRGRPPRKGIDIVVKIYRNKNHGSNEGCSIGLCLLVGWYKGLAKVSGKKTLKDYTALCRERCVTAGTAVLFQYIKNDERSFGNPFVMQPESTIMSFKSWYSS